MATPNTGSIPQESLNEVTPGLEQPMGSIADELCVRRTDVQSTSGTAPFLSTEMTTSKGLNKDLAPGETAHPDRAEMGEIEYECKRQVGMSEIYDETDIAAQRFDIELIDHFSSQAQQDADTATDRKFEDVITSTTDNLEFDATVDGNGAWDDTSNGTPVQDMVDMSDKVPHSTMVIVGRSITSALKKHPEVGGEVFHYSGGGVVTTSHLEGLIAEQFDIEPSDVHLLTDRTYDSAGRGQDFELDFIADTAFWVGAGYDLQMFDPDHPKNRRSWSDRVNAAGKEQVGFQRMVDIKRHIQENAITGTNLLS